MRTQISGLAGKLQFEPVPDAISSVARDAPHRTAGIGARGQSTSRVALAAMERGSPGGGDDGGQLQRTEDTEGRVWDIMESLFSLALLCFR